MIFEIFGRYSYNSFGIIYRIKSILKDLVIKIDFSLAFYAEKLKNVKIHFLVTKSGQNWNLITFSDPRPKTWVCFISNFPWIWALHTSSRGGCGSSNFGKDFPPPARNKDFSAHLKWHTEYSYCQFGMFIASYALN